MKLLKPALILLLIFQTFLFAEDEKKEDKSPWQSKTFSGLKFRSIGPAFTSGRIADFAVNPKNHSEYFVGVASGHIWKTENSGTTWKPVFDNYGSYSIGALKIDENNPNVIWAGTGENNHQRALGYGDGIYKSIDGGESWKNMGLYDSRQIGMIEIDPRNSDIVFVAAEGSVWGPGGDRGLYKTINGGKNWKKVLDIYATSIDYDPSLEASKQFFATIQNKMHWAAHGHTAAEIISLRADADAPNMGLTTWGGASKGRRVHKKDIAVAKNYLKEEELAILNRIVSAYLEFSELQAQNRRPMTMQDWIKKLDDFLRLSDREILTHAGKVTHELAEAKAEAAFLGYQASQLKLESRAERNFEAALLKPIKELEKKRK